MKNIYKIIWAVTILFLFNLVLISNLSAQCFYQASITDNSANTSTTVGITLNTGNDIKGPMHAWVYDGSSPKIICDYGSGVFQQNIQQSDAKDPDVAVYKDAGIWWAMIVYYTNVSPYNVGNGHYVCDVCKLTGSGFAHQYFWDLEQTPIGTACNIDIDVSGNYVIVWDDGTGVNVDYGAFSGGPVSSYSGSLLTNGESMPDVCIYDNQSIYYTYIDNTGAIAYVDKASISSPQLTSNKYTSTLTCNALNYPRVACPPSGTTDDFTVVFEYYNIVSSVPKFGIFGYNSIYGYPEFDYTNGCYDLKGFKGNERPVVTYSSGYTGASYNTGGQGLIVAWTFDSLDWVINQPLAQPLAVQCDYDGTPLSSTYMIVPSAPSTISIDVQNSISVAGRDASVTDIFYTWFYYFDGTNYPSKVENKDAPWTNTSLRIENGNTDNSQTLGIFPNPAETEMTLNLKSERGEDINIRIYNSLGVMVYSSTDKATSSFFSKIISINEFEDGIYLVNVSGSKEFSQNQNLKMIINK